MSTSTSLYILVLICILTVNTNTNTDTNAPTKLLTHVPRVWCMRPQYKACQKYTLYIYCKSFLYRLSSCVVCFVYTVTRAWSVNGGGGEHIHICIYICIYIYMRSRRDSEYSRSIQQQDLLGVYCHESAVYHSTARHQPYNTF